MRIRGRLCSNSVEAAPIFGGVLFVACLFTVAACGGTDGTTPVSGGDPPVVQIEIASPVATGTTVRLDASRSTDPDEEPLSFRWRVVSRPDGSEAELSDPESAIARVTPDVAGDYTFEVTVSDGDDEVTARRTVEAVEEPNESPVADAGADRTVSSGARVVLDATGSSDPEGDELEYAWTFVRTPDGSSAMIEGADLPIARFTADEAGAYELKVSVTDGESEAEDTVVIRVNRAPVAEVGPDLAGEVGAALELDGSASSDPDGDELSYTWTIVTAPDGSGAEIEGDTSVSASIAPDEAGLYIVQLRVSDGDAEATDRLTLTVTTEGGTGSSTLYLAPDGSDDGPGTEARPLATLGEGIRRAEAEESIARLRLASGTYDQGETTHAVGADLEIVGPREEARPVVVGTGDLLVAEETAFLALVRVELQTDGVALKVGDDAAVSASSVACRASYCVTTGEFFGDNGGRVSILDSTFAGRADARAGIIATKADEVTVADSIIEGFSGASGVGIRLLASSATVRDSAVLDNDFGLDLLANETDHAVLVRASELSGNDVGVRGQNAKNVTVRDSTITGSSDAGVRFTRGGFRMEGTTVANGGGDGIEVLAGAPGAVVTLRQSHVRSHQGVGIRVEGARTVLDLGTQSTSGGNEIRFNKGVSLYDDRPAGADGLITLSDTQLGLQQVPAGTYSGPNFSQYGIRIVNDNQVTVY